MPSSYEIARNDNKFENSKNMVLLYNKQKFKCLEQKSFGGVLSKLAASSCNLSHFCMLIVHKKNNSNTAQCVGNITHLVTTKHLDFILGDFNEDSFNDVLVKISLQSLGFSHVVSETTHIRGSCLEQSDIKNV